MAGSNNIAQNWKALSGENNWEGLLDPLSADLRRYLIQYGERVEAMVDAFIEGNLSRGHVDISPLSGLSRYPKEGFFSYVGLEKGNPYKYQVTKFLYAREQLNFIGDYGDPESNWIGYVAVATDVGKIALGRRDILIAWRGTMRKIEVILDEQVLQVSASDILGEANSPAVHRGWHSVYTKKDESTIYTRTSAREQVLKEVRRLVDLYIKEEISITVTGHSMGAALASLNAVDIVANGYNKPSRQPSSKRACMVTALAFASPRVGNSGFNEVFSVLNNNNLHLLRISNAQDWLPDIPQQELNYTHVGENLAIDASQSPYLKTYDQDIAHQLEVYLHGIAGTRGDCEDFKLVVKRDVSLLNKSMDILKDAVTLQVPVQWWIEKNKCMVQMDDGSWKLDGDVQPPEPPSP